MMCFFNLKMLIIFLFLHKKTPNKQTYCIRSNNRTYPYKRTLMKFRSLITASVLFIYFFIKAYVVGSHMNCIDLIQMSTHNICLYKENQKKKIA